MNKRIRELTVEANDQTGNEFDLNHKLLDAFLEKFAELIVEECAAIAKKKSLSVAKKAELYAEDEDEKITARATAWQISLLESEIKKHFGVA